MRRAARAGNDRRRDPRQPPLQQPAEQQVFRKRKGRAGPRLRPQQPAPQSAAADRARRHLPRRSRRASRRRRGARACSRRAQAGTGRDRTRRGGCELGRRPVSFAVVAISLASRQFEDPVGDDAELNFGGAGVDRLGPRLQINRPRSAAARRLHRGRSGSDACDSNSIASAAKRWCASLQCSFARLPRAPICSPSTSASTAVSTCALQHLDIDHGLRQSLAA